MTPSNSRNLTNFATTGADAVGHPEAICVVWNPMIEWLAKRFEGQISSPDMRDPEAVPKLVAALLFAARQAGATDVHLVPGPDALRMQWRIDGVLQPIANFGQEVAPRIIARLKVLADLLTYRNDVPQEGRIREADAGLETRVSTFPTLFGEKLVLRLFSGAGQYQRLAELGLPEEVLTSLQPLLDETGGVILLTGPAGSGKTTTSYACLRELVDKSGGGRSLVSLEDPIEVVVPGVSQSQVNIPAGLTLETGLKSLLRQDPEVMLVGEIRDRSTAEMVFQASLTGHLVVTTFHAGSAARAISRLSDMGIEPYLLRSGVLAIVCQRLIRRLCSCSRPSAEVDDRLGLPVTSARLTVGCSACQGTGYKGRMLIAEMLLPDQSDVGRAILSRDDSSKLEQLAAAAGMVTQQQRAIAAVEAGRTSPAEVRRVFGVSRSPEA